MARLNHTKQFKAIALVHTPAGIIDYASGWWYDEQKARAEVSDILEQNLAGGLYQVGTLIKERIYAL